MKKILLTAIAAGCSVAAFGQSTVLIENAVNSSAHWNLGTANGTSAPVGTDVALLWFNGSTFIQVGSTYTTTGANGDTASAGFGLYFYGNGQAVTVPTVGYQPTGTFEVEGWTGGYANYNAAVAAGAYTGLTASFLSNEGNPNASPIAGTPVGIAPGPHDANVPAGYWNGNLVLTVPEPTTIALGGLGAAALLLFRRRK